MPVDIGTAKGYVEIDFTNMRSGAADAAKELQKLQRQSDQTDAEFEKLQATTDKSTSVFKLATDSAEHWTKQIDTAKKRADVYKQGISGLTQHMEKAKSEQQRLATEVSKAKTQFEQSQQKVKTLGAAYKEAQAKAKALAAAHGDESKEAKQAATAQEAAARAYESAQKKSGTYRNELLQLTAKHDALGRDIEECSDKINEYRLGLTKTETEIAKMSRELGNSQNTLKQFGVQLQNSGEKLQAVGSKISTVGGTLSKYLTVPLAAAGTASFKFALDAETSFAKVSTIADSTVLSYQKLKDGVTKASNETGVAVTDFNEALYQSISAGVDSANAIQFTTDMVQLAKGGFTDTAMAVDVVTTTLNAYGLEANKATEIADRLVTTQNLGKTTVDELAGSLGRVIPTARAVNVDFDNVSAAMATLTKNGIATAEATTYYNSMLNELGKSGSEVDEALRELSGKGFAELIAEGVPMTDVLRMLTEYAAESGKSLSDMFGSSEAAKAALTLMKGDGAEYNEILQAMGNSAGAAQKAFEKMDATPAETMKKELNKLKNAGIEVGTELLPLATSAVKEVGKLAKSFNALSPETKKAITYTGLFAAAVGPITKVVSGGIDGIGHLTSSIGGLAKKLSKEAVPDIASATKSVSGLSGGIKGIINPTSLAITAVSALGIGVAIAAKKMHDDMIDAAIDKHFGNIKLSAEEAEEVAKRITTTDWTMKLDAVIDAKDKLGQFEADVKSAKAEIDKLDWKMSIGLELSDDEKEGYRSAVDSFVKSSVDYVEQQHYTVSLALKASFDEGSDTYARLSSFADDFYMQSGTEMSALGTRFADLLNEGFKTGIFPEAEMREVKQLMTDKMQELSDMEYSAKMIGFRVELGEIDGLDKKSFDEVNKKINEQWEIVKKDAEQTRDLSLGAIQMEFDDNIASGMAREEAEKLRDDAIKEMEATMAGEKATVILEGIDFSMDTVRENYGTEMDSALKDMKKTNKKWFKDYLEDTDENFEYVFTKLEDSAAYMGADLSDDNKKVMKDALNALEPQSEDLKKTAQAYLKAGMAVPENIRRGLSDNAEWLAAVGDIDGMYFMIGQQIGNSPEYFEALKIAQKNGQDIPKEVIEAIEISTGQVYDETTGMWSAVSAASEETIAEVKGILSEHGIEASNALINAIAEQKPFVRSQAYLLLDQLKNATDEQRPAILGKLAALGIAVDDSLGQGMYDNIKVVQTSAQGVIQLIDKTTGEEIAKVTPEFVQRLKDMGITGVEGMDEVVSNSSLRPPKISDINWDAIAENGTAKMQRVFNQNPLSVFVNMVTGGISSGNLFGNAYAAGGIVDTPQIAHIAEEAPGEAIIPLNPARRARATALWTETGYRLGVLDTSSRTSYRSASQIAATSKRPIAETMQVSGSIDYGRLAQEISKVLQRAPIHVDSTINNHVSVEMDKEIVGRKIAPVVSRQIAKSIPYRG